MKFADGMSVLTILFCAGAFFAVTLGVNFSFAKSRENFLSSSSSSSIPFIIDGNNVAAPLDDFLSDDDVGLIVPATLIDAVVGAAVGVAAGVVSTTLAAAENSAANVPEVAPEPPPPPEPEPTCVNINTADERQLVTLRGVGPATAANIVAYRNRHGRFRRLQDIQKVTGIGPSKFAQMRDDICI